MNARPSSRVNGNPPRNIFLVDGVWQFNLSRTRIIISVLTASTASPNRVWSSSSSSSYTRLLGGGVGSGKGNYLARKIYRKAFY